MGISISKVQKVRRVNTARRLETLVIEISSKFFFYVAQDASLMPSNEDRRAIKEKMLNFSTFTFSFQAELLQFGGICAGTFVALMSHSDVLGLI